MHTLLFTTIGPTFIDKLLPGSFQTMAKISKVGHMPQGGHCLPCSPPRAGAPGVIW